jgi:hypothetical protein
MGTEEDTFDRLRRATYAEACTEYTMVFLQYHARAGDDWCNEHANNILKTMGWSLKDLEHYGRIHEI